MYYTPIVTKITKNVCIVHHSLAPPTKIQESVQVLSNDDSHLRRFSPSTEINIDDDEANPSLRSSVQKLILLSLWRTVWPKSLTEL